MKGIYRLTTAVQRLQARLAWNELSIDARDAGIDAAVIDKLQPPENAGWRTIDKRIAKLRAALNELETSRDAEL